MGVFKKQGVYWIDYCVGGHRKRERIGLDKRLAEIPIQALGPATGSTNASLVVEEGT